MVDQAIPKPAYADGDLQAQFGGPLWRSSQLFVSGEQAVLHRASTQSARVPTLRERQGDLSRTHGVAGVRAPLVDPATGRPFEAWTIPPERLNPQAVALLAYYPVPTLDAEAGRDNYQAPVTTTERRRGLRTSLSQSFDDRNSVNGAFAFRKNTMTRTSLFGFSPVSRVSNLDASVRWRHRVPRRLSLRLAYQITSLSIQQRPHFAHVANVSEDAGLTGPTLDPANWGPPTLRFSSGLATLGDVSHAQSKDLKQAWSVDVGLFSRGRHTVQFGAGYSRHGLDRVAQPDPRGQFLFTGAATGSDLADFLLGLPQTASIAFGDAERAFHAPSAHVYLTDDWRPAARVTVTLGVRWEYEALMTERANRIVNLDLASGFTAAAPVAADTPVGSLTGRRYEPSLLRPDRLGFQPRLGVAWRPRADSALVLRASYGHYRTMEVYPSLATLLAHQPPLATTLTLERGAASPLTLATDWTAGAGNLRPTFAVDPDFRVGHARTWEASMQVDVPWALTLVTRYTGTTGHRLLRQALPNTVPPGATVPCPTCPVGFVYVTSDGRSTRHAAQISLRRRLRNGLFARVDYTLARAVDDGVAFGGAHLRGAAIAQDWRDPDAEFGRSPFDQRHVVTATFRYTPGGTLGGAGRWEGMRRFFLYGWTFTGSLDAGSGRPLTPLYRAAVPGTAITGTVRADRTEMPAGTDVPAGFFLNPAAYSVPPPGRWGNAARNSITGPVQVVLTGGLERSFAWGDRWTLVWRLAATNLLNQVTFAEVTPIVNSPQFGLPRLANPMRKVQTSLRLTF